LLCSFVNRGFQHVTIRARILCKNIGISCKHSKLLRVLAEYFGVERLDVGDHLAGGVSSIFTVGPLERDFGVRAHVFIFAFEEFHIRLIIRHLQLQCVFLGEAGVADAEQAFFKNLLGRLD